MILQLLSRFVARVSPGPPERKLGLHAAQACSRLWVLEDDERNGAQLCAAPVLSSDKSAIKALGIYHEHCGWWEAAMMLQL